MVLGMVVVVLVEINSSHVLRSHQNFISFPAVRTVDHTIALLSIFRKRSR
jgi:hypothetical protein